MKVHHALEQLCSSAIWLLVGARLRTQGLKRDPLARKLSGHALRQVLTLRLHNTGNSCYQNAFIMSWLWATVKSLCQRGRGTHR